MTLNRESKMGCRATSAACALERAARDGIFIDQPAGAPGKSGKQIGKCVTHHQEAFGTLNDVRSNYARAAVRLW